MSISEFSSCFTWLIFEIPGFLPPKEKKLFKEDTRPDKQKIAFRYLRGSGPEEWNVELPLAEIPDLKF